MLITNDTPKNEIKLKKNCKRIIKDIEIITVPKLDDINANQINVAIPIDEYLILNILSKYYKNVRITEINCKKDLEDLAKRKPDLVFSGVKFFYFNKMTVWLNDFLDTYSIPYIASCRLSLENEADKSLAKKIMKNADILTADFFITEPGEYNSEKSLPLKFPFFIKPISGGNSIGVDKNSVVTSFANFKLKINDIKNKQKLKSLVETYLSGREYSVGIFQDNLNGSLTAMPIEIIVKKNSNGDRIADYDIKKNDSENVLPVKNKKIFNLLANLSKKAFTALEGKSFGRIDIKMDKIGRPHFIEANLMPGLKKGYFYRCCLLNLKINYEQMILKIAKNAMINTKVLKAF